MPVEIDISHVARLARLALNAEEEALYQDQLGLILEHAAKVQDVDADDFAPTAHPLGLVNGFRPDQVRPSLDRDEVLAAAPDTFGPFFVVPPALEG